MVNKEKMSFEEVLGDEEGRKIVEAIEHIEDTEDPILIEIRKNLIKELKALTGYVYEVQ